MEAASFEIPAPPPEARPARLLAAIPGLAQLQTGLLRRCARQREQRYRDRLAILRADLAQLHTAEQSALAEQQPDPMGCVRLAIETPERLWQRDRQQLVVRVGATGRPSSLSITEPRPLDPTDPMRVDPLFAAAQELARHAAWLPEAPVCMPLDGGCGLRGARSVVLEVARALHIQLTCHWSPDVVRLAILFPEEEQAEWRWARWLPHVQLPSGSRRLGWDVESGERALTGATIVVVADPSLRAVVPKDAIALVLLKEDEPVPAGCSSVLSVDATLRGILQQAGADTVLERVDVASVEVADRFARALAGRTALPSADGEGIVEVHLDGTRTPLRSDLPDCPA